MGDVFPYLFVGGIVAVTLAAIGIQYWLEQRRRQKLEAVALQCGFQYQRESDTVPVDAHTRFDLFTRGRAPKSTSILRGSGAGTELVLFDYHYTIGSGRSQTTWVQTVAAFKLRAPVPAFALRKEGWSEKIMAAFGSQDIDFEAYPEFSKHYLLRGADEQAVRQLFTPGLIAFFESTQGEQCSVEGAGEWLIVYQLGKRSKPEELREFVDRRSQFATGIMSQLPSRSAAAF